MEELELNAITPELEKEIAEQVAAIKKADPSVKGIFPIVITGSEWDSKEMYVGYFKQPSFKVFSKYLTLAQHNQAEAMRQLAKDCFISGDKELIDDDSLFLFGLMGQLGKIIEMRNGKLVNLSKAGK